MPRFCPPKILRLALCLWWTTSNVFCQVLVDQSKNYSVKNGTKNYCFQTISTKIFQNRPAIKPRQGQLYIPVSLPEIFYCKTRSEQGRKPSRFLCLIEDKNNYPNSNGPSESNIGPSYFVYQKSQYPKDCTEVRNQCSIKNVSGVYLIKPDGYPQSFKVYCDNTEDSGGWTVIQRLEGGSVIFNRSWTEYKIGFGFLFQEFWIGHDKLAYLTNQKLNELRIDFTSADGLSFYVTYSTFLISDEYGEYKLTSIGEYKGTEDVLNSYLCPPTSEGRAYISTNCSHRCFCTNGQFSCDDTYQCNPNAVCEERGNVLRCFCNEGFTGDGVTCTVDFTPLDCQDVFDSVSTESGVYKIKPSTWPGEPFEVYCNMTEGGGWTVIQRRINGSLDFHLYWVDYKIGFGTPDHELWLGNDKLNSLTTQKNYELRLDLVNSFGDPYYAQYSSFSVSDESDKYRLSRGSYNGNAGDSLTFNNGQPFTTRDRDNDASNDDNCATLYFNLCGSYCFYNAGWWYHNCGHSLINGPYGTNCFYWHSLPGIRCNMKYTEMKVRPT